jgi:hypothetical protein
VCLTPAISACMRQSDAHNYTATPEEGVALALLAGTDIDSASTGTWSSTGGEYIDYLPGAIEQVIRA